MIPRQSGRCYHVEEPDEGFRELATFDEAETAKLRAVAETLAMLDGNAFFGMELDGERPWFAQYLPEAAALYEANGGDNGWAGVASFGPEGAASHMREGEAERVAGQHGITSPLPVPLERKT